MINDGSITDWMQGLSAVVTLILAAVTYSLSRKMLHTPYRTFLKPKRYKSNNDYQKLQLYVTNLGPNIALNIKVTIEGGTVIQANGPEELEPGGEACFTIEATGFKFTDPVKITWESVSGEQKATVWKYGRTSNEEFFERV